MIFLYGAIGGIGGVLILLVIVGAVVLFFAKPDSRDEPPHP